MHNSNYKIDEIAQEFSDDAWYAFHQGEINESNDLDTLKTEWIDNKTTNTYECKEYCDELNYDIFDTHLDFGRPNNWHQAGYNALWDALNESNDTVQWNEMEKVLTDSTIWN